MLAREEQVSNGGIAHSGSRRQTGSGRCRTPVEVDVAEGDGAADSGRAARSRHILRSPRSAATGAFRGARARWFGGFGSGRKRKRC